MTEKENGDDSFATYIKYIIVILVILFAAFLFFADPAAAAALFSFGQPEYKISSAFGITK